MSDRTVQELIQNVCSEISGLFRVSEAIAMLDLLAAFAQVATCQDYIRPELTDVLAIKSGRHPIREKIHVNKFIPNDAYATQQARFQIITGCNMSGKSTYIRSLALMTVMAQIGCFIPAEYASFPMLRQLFARVSTADDMEANVSTFAVEMREMAFILRNLEPRSMVIIDELGRGTSTTDGLAIALAIAEALIESNALVWFVTHFHDLAVILAERTGVVNLHLAADISVDSSTMTMLYRVAEGPVEKRFYGLALAQLVDLPPKILIVAQGVSERLAQIARRRQSETKALIIARKRKLILLLREQVLQARNGSMDGEVLRKWLRKLQDEFTLRVASIDEGVTVFSDIDDENEEIPSQSKSKIVESSPLDLSHGREGGNGNEDEERMQSESGIADDSPSGLGHGRQDGDQSESGSELSRSSSPSLGERSIVEISSDNDSDGDQSCV